MAALSEVSARPPSIFKDSFLPLPESATAASRAGTRPDVLLTEQPYDVRTQTAPISDLPERVAQVDRLTAISLQIDSLRANGKLFARNHRLDHLLGDGQSSLAALTQSTPDRHLRDKLHLAASSFTRAEASVGEVRTAESAPRRLTAGKRRNLEQKTRVLSARRYILDLTRTLPSPVVLSRTDTDTINYFLMKITDQSPWDWQDLALVAELSRTIEDFLNVTPADFVQMVYEYQRLPQEVRIQSISPDSSDAMEDAPPSTVFLHRREVVLRLLTAVKQTFGRELPRGGNLQRILSTLSDRLGESNQQNAYPKEEVARLQTLLSKSLRHPLIQGFIRLSQTADPQKRAAYAAQFADRLEKSEINTRTQIVDDNAALRDLHERSSHAAYLIRQAVDSSLAALSHYRTWLAHEQHRHDPLRKKLTTWIRERIGYLPALWSGVDQLPTRVLETYYALADHLSPGTFTRMLKITLGTASAIGLVLIIREAEKYESQLRDELARRPAAPIVWPPNRVKANAHASGLTIDGVSTDGISSLNDSLRAGKIPAPR